MSGVYGDFLGAFPELLEAIEIWTAEDRSDKRVVMGTYVPGKGDSIKRRKYTSGNTGLDVVGQDCIYTFAMHNKIIYVGDYVSVPDVTGIWRIVNIQSFERSADYIICSIEKVTGTTSEHTEELPIKEARF